MSKSTMINESDSEEDEELLLSFNTNKLIGQYIKLRNINTNEILSYEIESIGSAIPIYETKNTLPDLVKESTNQWLFMEHCECSKEYQEEWRDFSFGVLTISVQILVYITMSQYVIMSYRTRIADRLENCYGTNCKVPEWKEIPCMRLSTGAITLLMLVGFLWADFLNTLSMIRDSFDGITIYKQKLCASIFILIEIVSALFCGVIVVLLTDDAESSFDAINGAVGILFVHDFDEKMYLAINVVDGNIKKIVSLILWIFLSLIIVIPFACVYSDDLLIFGGYSLCTQHEFKCNDGTCIWYGFVCNGVRDCVDGEDEQQHCDFSKIICPYTMFKCETTGSCIDIMKRCNGMLDCEDGSDEAHNQNCSALIDDIVCGDVIPVLENKYNNNNWYLKPNDGAMFKCNSGQCIDAKYLCDGFVDCLDASDEYPRFYKPNPNDFPYSKTCPYSRLVECQPDEVLCKLNGKCISKMRICDGHSDCPDSQDEINCNTNCDAFSYLYAALDVFQCGSNIAKINVTNIILFENETMLNLIWVFTDSITDEITINDWYPGSSSIAYVILNDSVFMRDNITKAYWTASLRANVVQYARSWINNEYLKDSTAKCISITDRCDGISDCNDSSDEMLCHLFECNEHEYQCPVGSVNAGKCIPNNWICDGICDCGQYQQRYCPDEYKMNMDEDNVQKCKETEGSLEIINVQCNDGGHFAFITRISAQTVTFHVQMFRNYTNISVTTCHENATDFRTKMELDVLIKTDLNVMPILVYDAYSEPQICYNGFANIILIEMSEFWGKIDAAYTTKLQSVFIQLKITQLYPKEMFGEFKFFAFCF
eukprot:546135_1